MPPKPLPPLSVLQALFSYSVVTGRLYWKKGSWKGHVAGRERVGTRYLEVRFSRQSYGAHRLIWKLVTGSDPGTLDVDHVDGDRTNNSWLNLRIGTRSQNLCNRPKQSNNTSGFKGVSFFTPKGKWRAVLTYQGVSHHLGYFATPEEASLAYAEASRKIHGDFAYIP